jgi:hypothetical protein
MNKKYFAPNNHYFKVKEYVEDMDYLRLLVIQDFTVFFLSLESPLLLGERGVGG